MVLPNRLFYTVTEAANKLSCSVSDLLHFADIGLLEICTPICGQWISKAIQEDEHTFIYDALPGSFTSSKLSVNYPSTFDNIDSKILFISRDNGEFDTPEDIRHSLFGVRKLSIDGLMSMHAISRGLSFYDFDKLGCSSSSIYSFSAPRTMKNNEENHMGVRFDIEPFNIELSDLFITEEEIELLKNGGDLLLSSLFIGSNRVNNKEPSTKTTNKQAEVIKTLIEVNYGKGVAKRIRSEIDNPKSKLRISFDNAGIEFPASGVTVEGWIKNTN